MTKARVELIIKCVSTDECSEEDLKSIQEALAHPEKRKELFKAIANDAQDWLKADVVTTQRVIIKEVSE